MSNPPPLDAAARDELRAKAEAAKARAHEGWYLGGEHICTSGAGAIGDFIAACTPDVILALLAAVERGEAETALLRDLLKYVDDDAHSAALHGETDEIACAFGDRIRATLAARAHPPIQETDNEN